MQGSVKRWVSGVAALVLLSGGQAAAQGAGPVDGSLGFQPAATAVQQQVIGFHNFVLPILVAVTVLVLGLLAWVIIAYRRGANPVARKFSHNTLIEIIWTVVPVLILVAIAFPSFPLLALEERVPKADLTLKATGNSWYWDHEYPDLGVSISSNVLDKETAAEAGKPYLLAVDEPLYAPVGAVVEVIVTSNDVIHSWAMPTFGVKQDAIPGKLNQGWFKIEREGVYYGQCSELCGIRHAYMPIEIHAVSPARFAAWVTEKGGDASLIKPAVQTAALTSRPE